MNYLNCITATAIRIHVASQNGTSRSGQIKTSLYSNPSKLDAAK